MSNKKTIGETIEALLAGAVSTMIAVIVVVVTFIFVCSVAGILAALAYGIAEDGWWLVR